MHVKASDTRVEDTGSSSTQAEISLANSRIKKYIAIVIDKFYLHIALTFLFLQLLILDSQFTPQRENAVLPSLAL